jgi:predicted nuclease of predicted toxin-antitoxin system
VKFLVDQDVYALTTRYLRDLGHDGVTAAEIGMSRATDMELLAEATQAARIFVTRDRDFGSLVFLWRVGKGVILLRIIPSAPVAVHAELKRVLETHTEAHARTSSGVRSG